MAVEEEEALTGRMESKIEGEGREASSLLAFGMVLLYTRSRGIATMS